MAVSMIILNAVIGLCLLSGAPNHGDIRSGQERRASSLPYPLTASRCHCERHLPESITALRAAMGGEIQRVTATHGAAHLVVFAVYGITVFS